jgi:hypothetical protein
VALIVVLVSSLARPAFAHGFGQTYDLPLPLWLYLWGAGAAVLISFVPISLFAGGAERGAVRVSALRRAAGIIPASRPH